VIGGNFKIFHLTGASSCVRWPSQSIGLLTG